MIAPGLHVKLLCDPVKMGMSLSYCPAVEESAATVRLSEKLGQRLDSDLSTDESMPDIYFQDYIGKHGYYSMAEFCVHAERQQHANVPQNPFLQVLNKLHWDFIDVVCQASA
ncbi:unnamed protein product, partial [Bubo scandiacus]